MTPQGYPLWAAWDTSYGPVVGWQRADKRRDAWWPVVVAELPVGDVGGRVSAAVIRPYARLFATPGAAQEWARAEQLRRDKDAEMAANAADVVLRDVTVGEVDLSILNVNDPPKP
jgi:hypothetical protein